MLNLTRVRVINWHGYQEEVCRLDGSALITGQNGVGKTTLLDAIQYALVADQTMVRFNKANENSRRTLTGYCRWHISAEEEGGNGKGRYLRGATTSYVMLEFKNAERPESDFVCGVVIETTDGESIREQRHFIAPQVQIEEIPALQENRVPRSWAEFRPRLQGREGWTMIHEASRYRDEIRHRLGFLPTSFQRLLVKALDFKPIGSVRPFIMDFLLEERTIETGPLIRNVENYQRLEAEARTAERRIHALHGILAAHKALVSAKDSLQRMEYMVLRAREEVAEEDMLHVAKVQLSHEQERDQVLAKQERAEEEERRLGRVRDDVIRRLGGMPEAQQRLQFESELRQVTGKLTEARAAQAGAQTLRGSMHRALDFVTGSEAQRTREAFPEWFAKDPFASAPQVQKLRSFLTEETANGTPDERRARPWRTALEDATQVYTHVMSRANAEMDERAHMLRDLHREKEELDEGQRRYPLQTQALLHLLNRRLGADEEIRPLCEQIEMRDAEWTDAAEGLLGSDRLALIVPPELYERATDLYRRHKDGYVLPGRGEISLHSTKVIDMRGVLKDVQQGRGSRSGSLAEQVTATNELARAFVDASLGNVMTERNVLHLRRHTRAVTPDVMVHQGHGTFRMNPRQYETHYIGSASHSRRYDQIVREATRLLSERDQIESVLQYVRSAYDQIRTTDRHFETYVGQAATGLTLPSLQRQMEDLKRQMEMLDRNPALRELEAEEKRLKDEIDGVRQQVQVAATRAGELEAEIRKAKQTYPVLRTKYYDALERLGKQFPDETMRDAVRVLEERYKERRATLSARDIETNYDGQQKNRETRVGNLRQEMRDLQNNFDNTFKFPPPPLADAENISPYESDLAKWEESRLPEYQRKIEQARQDAKEQLARDYLYQLYDSFQLMEERFADMSDALRAPEARVGWGRYAFTHTLIDNYKSLYNLVLALGTAGPGSLWDDPEQFTEARAELDRLADAILRENAEKLQDVIIRDYREFFDYDLKLHRDDGKVESFKNASGAGSGGEHQVPYYIAMFSALYHVYRSRTKAPSCGLVLLDEAFAKMDEQRIESVLGLARHMKLQLIMVTPGDKVATIVPRVETTLLVQRDQGDTESVPVVYRFNKEMLADALEALDADRTVAAPAA